MTGASIGDDAVARAITEIAAGRPVVVLDDGPTPHGRLVLAADAATPEVIAFLIRHTTGLVCAAMRAEDLDRLDVPPMTPDVGDRAADAFAVSVDARDGITTGISATDRARTLRLLADPGAGAADLVRPGHVVPIRVREGGVLARAGVAEAAVDLAAAAGRRPAGVLADLVADEGPLLTPADCQDFADRHGLALLTTGQLAAHRRRFESLVERTERTRMSTRHGELPVLRYTDGIERDRTAVVLVPGLDGAGRAGSDVLVAVHGECQPGDVFGSVTCDCGARLRASLRAVARSDHAVLVHLRGGGDPHRPLTEGDLDLVAQVLRDLGVRHARLLTVSPALVAGLRYRGIEVRVAPAQRPDRAARATA